MTELDPIIAGIARDPLWLPHRYDPVHDAVHFRRVTREEHARTTFLTDDYLGVDANPAIVRRSDAMAAAPPTAPLHFIFHSAFCCSTLLARAMDAPGLAMGLKEPVILNDIVGWRRRGGPPARVAAALDDSLTLLARPFGLNEAVVIKPSNVVAGLIPSILTMRPEARALILHAPLRTFVGSIARKGLWGRNWVRDLLVKLLSEDLITLGFRGDDYLKLTDLQVAAVGWLAQHQLFARTIEKFGDRVRSLDSDTLLAHQARSVAVLADHYGLAPKADKIAAIIGGTAFTTHSKTGRSFGAEDRESERKALEAAHADEIDKVTIWAEAVAANAGVHLTLGAPLIS